MVRLAMEDIFKASYYFDWGEKMRNHIVEISKGAEMLPGKDATERAE